MRTFGVAVAACCVLLAAAAPSGARRVPNRFLLTLTGTMHVQSVETVNCDPGTARTTEDGILQISTPQPLPVWISTGGPDPPPPPIYHGHNFPGIYGFGHNTYMVFAVRSSVLTRLETCGGRPRPGRCVGNGRAEGRLEAFRPPPRQIYLVQDSAVICRADAHEGFIEDLFQRPAFATVPLERIARGEPRSFGVHIHQQRKRGAQTVTLDLDWEAQIAPADAAVAVASASPAVRGDRVTLDGSRSFSRIESYEWKVAKGADCPAGVKVSPELLGGKRVSFIAPCSFRARLTVTNQHDSDSKTISVQVQPRPWKTPFSVAPEGKLRTRLVDGFLQFGRNVCAYDGLTGEQTSGHILHRSGPRGGHKTRGGFSVAGIASGPFKCNFYVGVYRAKVRRASLISEDLFSAKELEMLKPPGPGDLYAKNAAEGRLADLLALRKSVRNHEELHGTLIERALAKDDRAKEIEKLAGPSEGDLEDEANAELVKLETALTEATDDEKVKAAMRARWSRPATVWVRDGAGDFVLRTFPSLAEIGDKKP